MTRAGGVHSAQEILAGLGDGDRRIERRRNQRSVPGRSRVLMPCGTDAAYLRHYRHGETPCQECKAAHAQTSFQRRRRVGKVKPYHLYLPAQMVPLVIEAARTSGMTTADWARNVLYTTASRLMKDSA